MLFVRDVPDGFVRLSAQVDSRHVSVPDAEAILLGIEAVLVEAACDGAACVGTASIDAASTETASIETASIDTAPIETVHTAADAAV